MPCVPDQTLPRGANRGQPEIRYYVTANYPIAGMNRRRCASCGVPSRKRQARLLVYESPTKVPSKPSPRVGVPFRASSFRRFHSSTTAIAASSPERRGTIFTNAGKVTTGIMHFCPEHLVEPTSDDKFESKDLKGLSPQFQITGFPHAVVEYTICDRFYNGTAPGGGGGSTTPTGCQKHWQLFGFWFIL